MTSREPMHFFFWNNKKSLSTTDNNAAKEETGQRVEQNKTGHCYGQEIIENYTGKK
ncbi:MAG: hypothetical protein ACK51L_03760 [bacterium]